MTALEAALAGESFAAIFNLGNLLIFLFLSLGNTALLTLVAGKFLLALQQCGYKGKRYLKWVRGKHNGYFSRLMLLSLMSILFFCVTCMCFSTIGGEWVRPSAYIGLLAYLLFILVYLDAERHVTAKLPLKMTRRLVRLIVTYVLLQLILNFGLIVLTNYIVFATKSELYFILRYFPICFLPLLAPFVLWLAYIINEPMERANNRRYIRDCKRVLDQSDIVKIGITGSFGKTSVKNILTGILSQKYRVLSTPGSYNTPLGISLTVKKLDATHDIFIAEMGARHVGDISDLAAIVKPQYAVLTGVNTQHLESFGSEEKILETKFELFEGLSPDGVGFFSADNAGSLELYRRFGGTKFLAGISEGDDLVFADEIDISEHGTAFTPAHPGRKAGALSDDASGKAQHLQHLPRGGGRIPPGHEPDGDRARNQQAVRHRTPARAPAQSQGNRHHRRQLQRQRGRNRGRAGGAEYVSGEKNRRHARAHRAGRAGKRGELRLRQTARGKSG